MPLVSRLVTALEYWRRENCILTDLDWVFASELTNGSQPVWLDSVLKRVGLLIPARLAAGCTIISADSTASS